MRGISAGHPSRGVALILVLWVLVMLSVLAASFVSEIRYTSAGVRNYKEETIARSMALSAFNEALVYLMTDKDLPVDYVDAEGNFRADREREPVTGTKTTPEGEVTIRIVDEGSKININFSDEDKMRRVFEYVGVPQDEMSTVIDSINDWKDPDTAHRLQGAEDEYYEGMPTPYKAKNAFVDAPAELMLIKGMKQEYFGQAGTGLRLDDLITTFGRPGLNINTARREILELLGMSPVEIEAVFRQRTAEAGGFRFVPPQFSARGFSSTSATMLTVDVAARVSEGKAVSHITAVVERRPGPFGFLYQTFYWRERVEIARG